MFRLGLTGSIATGKSTVLKMFADLGLPTYSADVAVHELYTGEAVAPLSQAFPAIIKDGAVDREALAAILVETPEKLAAVEAIVHPLVFKKMQAFLTESATTGADVAILEIPLLFETGRDYQLHAIAVTTCNDEEQRRRALARPGMSVEKFETILARQLPQADKQAQADFVIRTDVSLAQTQEAVKNIVDICRNRSIEARQ